MAETLDSLPIGGLDILPGQGWLQVFHWTRSCWHVFVRIKNRARVVDLGAGCGVLSLLLAKIGSPASVIGVERQVVMAERAMRNVSHNALEATVRILAGDIREIRTLLPCGQFDLVVSNPPFRQPDCGRVAPGDERAAARHELSSADWMHFVRAASWLLNNGGAFAVIHLAERLAELLSLMQQERLQPKRIRMVHPHADEAARLVLVEGVKSAGSGLLVEAPLIIYDSHGDGRHYSEEVLAIYC